MSFEKGRGGEKFWDERVGTGEIRILEAGKGGGGEGEREEQDGYGYGLGGN